MNVLLPSTAQGNEDTSKRRNLHMEDSNFSTGKLAEDRIEDVLNTRILNCLQQMSVP